MSELELFNFDGQKMRVIVIDDEPWFVAIDACAMLGLAHVRNAVAGLDEDERNTATVTDSSGRDQDSIVISESGLYGLILRSRRPEAKAIRRWVTGTVLPAIRKTGSYGVATSPALPPPTRLELAQMVIEAETALAEQRALVAEMEPKAQLADTLMSADGDWSVREAAHVLSRDPSISTGQRRLFATLRELGWIDRKGIPYQEQIESGRLATKTQVYDHPHTKEPTMGHPQVRVTGKGLAELHRALGGTVSIPVLI
jgi:prophage antirepressor-like protein